VLISIILRNYKGYYGLYHFPLMEKHKFITFIGDNGIGKSSILEALDTFFNNRPWNVNNLSKTRGIDESNIPHIILFFKINTNDFNRFSKDTQEKIKKINKFFEEIEENNLGVKQEIAKNAINHIKNNLEKNHYIFMYGKNINNEVFLGSFENELIKFLDIEGVNLSEKKKELRSYFVSLENEIKEFYSYVYIPVEIDIEDFTKLEKQDIQKLMGKDIKKVIEEAIKKESLMKINKVLNDFLNQIKNDLDIYFYHNKSGRKNISMNELVNEVIKLFFSIRTLHKKIDNTPPIPVAHLSSGEKRQVIIDVVNSFINSQKYFDKYLILGIDEPEGSLNISKRFTQFEKLFKLANNDKMQIFITTHWYGFIPIIQRGDIFYLFHNNNKIEKKYFNLFNYREKIKNDWKLPNEIELKSINDLIQSIISSLKADKPYNWLICEGSSEKIYFEYYFEDLIKNFNLRILPVGGYKEVKKIYEYLILPLQDKGLSKNIKGKIFCLVDTDKQLNRFETKEDRNLLKILKLRRLYNNENTKKTELLKIQDNKVSPSTEIEDCLNSKIFLETIKSFNDKKLYEMLKNSLRYENNNVFFAFDLRQSEIEELKKWFDTNEGYRKIEFAEKYVEKAKLNEVTSLEWIEEIKTFFVQ